LFLNGDGSFTYIPNPDFCGSDSFTYQVYDGTVINGPEIVDISVFCVNDPPVATSQNLAVNSGSTILITLTASDVDGDPLTFSVVGGPSNGTLSGTAPNLFYTANAGSSGTSDSFTFVANDGTVNSNTATVGITIN